MIPKHPQIVELYEDFKYIPILVGTRTNVEEPHPMSKKIEAYPNPFKSSLNIKIEIKSGETLLKIVDSSGREIEEIVNKKLNYGIHNFRYDGTHLKNGLYFILLENEGKRSGISVIKRS